MIGGSGGRQFVLIDCLFYDSSKFSITRFLDFFNLAFQFVGQADGDVYGSSFHSYSLMAIASSSGVASDFKIRLYG